MSNVCDHCIENVPLDLFLPMEAWGTYRRGLAWFLGVELFKGENAVAELDASRRRGCPLCRIIWTALEAAEPLWAQTDFKGTGHRRLLHAPRPHASEREYEPGIKLFVTVEGEMRITDGRRTSGCYWEVKSKGYGTTRAPIRSTPNCDENFDLMKAWLKECMDGHEQCSNHQADEVFLPARLVDIGPNNDSAPLQPRLIETRSLEEQVPYFALSYCWGTDRGKTVLKSTSDNLASHLRGIETADLSQTYVDAMEVVRKLGYRYIWIDALCIIQDDISDFEVECSQMHRIYSRAHCTIVASDSADGDGGCFMPRDKEGLSALTYHAINKRIPYYPDGIMDVIRGRFKTDPDSADVIVYPGFGPWIKGINHGAVSRRGWCLQEREMSPRVLHFTQSRILWECRESVASEDAIEMVSKATQNAGLGSHLSSARLFDDQKSTTKTKSKGGVVFESPKWNYLAETYSHRKLSVPADKLPAISGLAAIFASQNPDNAYLAGIWRHDLLKGVSWIPDGKVKASTVDSSDSGVSAAIVDSLQNLSVTSGPTELTAIESWPPEPIEPSIPSWSWAAHEGPIRFCGESWYSGTWTKIIGDDGEEKWAKSKAEVDIESASVYHTSKDPFGRIQGGELILQGWIAEVSLSESNLREQDETEDAMNAKCYNGPDGASVMIYFDRDVERLPRVSVLLLQLGTGKNPRATDIKADCGLVLAKSTKVGDAYQRVGIFDVTGDKQTWHELRKRETVRIV